MSYEDSFESPSAYYSDINELISEYIDRGYVHESSRWEQKITQIADMPDLKRLASQAKFQLQLLHNRPY